MSNFSNILIKYSVVSAAPMSLLQGELAYSQSSENLYIGSDSGVPVLIGGADLVARFGTVEALVGTIETELNTAKGNIQTLLSNINSLSAEMTAEDQRLQGEIDSVSSRVSTLESSTIPGIELRVNDLEASQTVQDGQINDHETRIGNVEAMLGGGSGTPTFTDLTVTGNLTVNGTTTAINSTVTTLNDPVISLGDGTGVNSDGMDRGVSFKHTVNGQVKTGFFGMDASDGKFKFIPDATEVADNVFEGDAGTIVANVEGSATSLATPRNIIFDNEVSGGFSFNGTADVTVGLSVNGTADATGHTIVRRDTTGAAKFSAVETSTLSNMYGGINGKSQFGAPSALTGFVINGGTF
jgi:hypothetical protein